MERLEPKMSGQSYAQKKAHTSKSEQSGKPKKQGKRVTFQMDQKEQLERLERHHNLFTQVSPNQNQDLSYSDGEAVFMIKTIGEMRNKAVCFGQQHMLQRGIKLYGDKARAAALKEITQQHQRECFEPILVSDLSFSEKRKV